MKIPFLRSRLGTGVECLLGGGRYNGGEGLAREKAEASFLNLWIREGEEGRAKGSGFHALDFLLVGTKPSVRVQDSGHAVGSRGGSKLGGGCGTEGGSHRWPLQDGTGTTSMAEGVG